MSYVQHSGPNDYGPRKGTLGLALHMSEGTGGDNDLHYLLGDPARGVSANFFSHSDGSIHQMMPIAHASGSLNPKDRATSDKGFYGAQHLIAVLGDHWGDPNAWSISIEIGGKRAQGPNARQVAAVIAWGLDMRARYPSLVGAFGHADQTDTKGCPGTSPAMLEIFAGIGGHGRFTEDDMTPLSITAIGDVLVDVPAGTVCYDLDGKTAVATLNQELVDRPSPHTVGSFSAIYITTGGRLRLVLVRPKVVKPVPPADVAAAIAADRARARIVYT